MSERLKHRIPGLASAGDYARDAVNGAFEVESRPTAPGSTGECRTAILRLSAEHRAIWLHTYHPRAVDGRPFGTPHARYKGVSDDAQGVQWDAGVDRERGVAWLGVNLEGMAYDRWPIARLIERELDHPTLPDLCGGLHDAGLIMTSWDRDAWQAAARLPIGEIQLGDTPTALDTLDPDKWLTILLDAYGRLDPDKNHRGRAKQIVTLKSGKVAKRVSSRLHFNCVLWRSVPRSQDEAEALVRRGRETLEPIHHLVARSSR